MKLGARLNKLVSFIASLSLLANSLLTPFSIAYAQDASPTPEPTPLEVSTLVATVEPTVTPVATEEPSSSPIETIRPEVTTTPITTGEVVPSPTPEETIIPIFAPESIPTTQAPPEVKSEKTEASSTPTATSEQPKENGHISAVVLSDTSAVSFPVDDLTVNTDGSATLQTDKADYAPTDAVLVTGSGFLADKTYTIIISSTDDPAVTHEDGITADNEGKIIYTYQLDGNYRPNYKVEIKDGERLVAFTTFTDSRTINSVTLDGGSLVTVVLGGKKVAAQVTVTTDNIGSNDWKCTAWSIAGSGVWTNENTDNHTNAGSYTEAFDIISPASIGTYSISFRAYSDDSCTDGGSEIYTLSDSIIVENSWPTSWQTPNSCVTDPTGDESPDEADLTGDSSTPAVGFASDANFEFFRERVDGNPGTSDNLHEYGWVTLFQKTAPEYQYLASVTGKNVTELGGKNFVILWKNDPITGPVDFSPLFSDSADTILWSGNSSDYSRVINAGGGKYYIDWAIPVNELNALGITTSTTKFFATATDGNNYNKDHLKCYEAISDLSIVKSDSPDPVISGGTLTYTLTISNAGPDTASGVVVTDTLPAGYSVTSVTPSKGSCSDQSAPGISCELGDMASGSSAIVTIVGTVVGDGVITNNSSVTLDTTKSIDTNLTNNTDSEDTTINPAVGTLIVHKDVQGPNGEDIIDDSQDFTVRLDGEDPRTFTDGGTITYSDISAGEHTLMESVIPSGYTFYSFSQDSNFGIAGAQINVPVGGEVEVTIVNYQLNATITIHKDVINPDGSTVSDGHEFTVLRDGSNGKTLAEGADAIYTVAPGEYTFTEDPGTDYTLNSITGDNDADIGNGATLTVGPGGSAELTFVNKQKKATINVNKDVVKPDGFTDVSDNHAFTALLNNGTGQSFSELTPTSYTVNPGQYTISEDVDGDYINLGCKLVTGEVATSFDVPSNSEIEVTCKNKQKLATITVEKDVVKFDGSAVDDPNTFSVTLNSETKDFGEGVPAEFTVDPGSYGATEGIETNYILDSNDGPKVVGSNGSATIHIVNKQKPGEVSGYKYDATSNQGIADWVIKLYTCSQTFTDCILGLTTSTDTSGFYTFTDLLTGFYQVIEGALTGWTPIGDTSHNITINPGTISDEGNDFVNFENVKVKACKVIDADGDIGTSSDQSPRSGWTVYLLVDGQTNDTKVTEEDGCYEWADLGPNHAYGVSEETPMGWTSLTDTTYNFGFAESGSEYLYTFANFENAQIIVHKNVLGTDGVTNVSDTQEFTALLGGINGKPVSENSDATYTDLGPGTYTVSEDTAPSGYQFVSITDGGVVTVESGKTYEVTITNKQVSAILVITKEVITDNGGNESAGDFTIIVDGTNVSSTGFPGEENGTTVYLDAGVYSVDEDPFDGYTKILGEGCSGTIAFGETRHCTITNDDIAPKVTLIKEVRGNEEVSVNDFGLTIGDTSVNSGDVLGVNANTPISLNEAGLDGYSFDSMVGDEGCPTELGGTVTLDEGESITCTIINTRDTGNIEGYKFEDFNGNGSWDENEPGLDGWTIELWNDQQVLVNSMETSDDPLGQYAFENIPTGEYEVCEVLNDGWQQTYPEGCHSLTLTKEGIQGLDFGNFKLGMITTCKYNDVNGNGRIDDETTISGVTINLSVWDEENSEWFPSDSQETGENGCVSFSELSAGDYQISEEVPAGYYQTNPSDPDYFEKFVESGTDVIYNFLNSPYRTISGQKYNDLDGDGQKDLGEPGLQDWTIYVDNNFNSVLDGGDISTITDTGGNYQFTNLVSDMYRIREVVDTGWTQTEPSSDYYDVDVHDVVGSEGNVFGNFRLASIGDFIWQDNNGDGIEDPGEPGIVGIDVDLYKNDGDGTFEPGAGDLLIGTETTDGAGGYLFENLGPGGYWIDVVDSTLPAGYVNTTSDPIGPIILDSGEAYLLADEGFVPPVKEIIINKTNDKSNTFAGDIVTYTLTLTTSNQVIFGNITVKDVLPGGFTYITGSTVINGSPSSDPSISGGVLEWIIENPKLPLIVSYKAIIASDLTNGTYKNLATCTAFVNRTEETVDCNIDDSPVTLGQGFSYGGSLSPQVLGASTELPATGSATWILLLAGLAGIFGFGLKIYGKKRYAKD